MANKPGRKQIWDSPSQCEAFRFARKYWSDEEFRTAHKKKNRERYAHRKAEREEMKAIQGGENGKLAG